MRSPSPPAGEVMFGVVQRIRVVVQTYSAMTTTTTSASSIKKRAGAGMGRGMSWTASTTAVRTAQSARSPKAVTSTGTIREPRAGDRRSWRALGSARSVLRTLLGLLEPDDQAVAMNHACFGHLQLVLYLGCLDRLIAHAAVVAGPPSHPRAVPVDPRQLTVGQRPTDPLADRHRPITAAVDAPEVGVVEGEPRRVDPPGAVAKGGAFAAIAPFGVRPL